MRRVRPSNFLILNLIALLFLISCDPGSGGKGNSIPIVTIKGVAMLGPVSNGRVSIYAALPDGQPDTTQLLGSGTTDTDGSYSIDILQPDVVGNLATLVVQLTSGSYVEEGSGKTVTLSTPLNTILPVDSNNKVNGETIQVAITPFTDMAAQRYQQQARQAVITKALDEGLIPDSFKGQALDPNFKDPAFEAALKQARRDFVFQEKAFIEQTARIAINANYVVSQTWGIKNVVGTQPDNPTIGGQSQDGAAYMVNLAALSHQAFLVGTDSVAMTHAIGGAFANSGNFGTGSAAATVQDASGKNISLPPTQIENLSTAANKISTGEITLPGFTLIAKSSNLNFKPPTFNGQPPSEAPADWTPGVSTLKPPADDASGSNVNRPKK